MSEKLPSTRDLLLMAASHLQEAATGMIQAAMDPEGLAREADAYAADDKLMHPLGEEFETVCSALDSMATAIGRPVSVHRLTEAADRFYRGED